MKIACHRCGACVEGQEFCPECGAALPQLYTEGEPPQEADPRRVNWTALGPFLFGFALIVTVIALALSLGAAG